MVKKSRIWLQVLFLLPAWVVASPFEYISPVSGTCYHKSETTIIVRPGERLEASDLQILGTTRITGTLSGDVGYSLKLVEEDRVCLIIPEHGFSPGEQVTVNFYGKYAYDLTFQIEPKESAHLQSPLWREAEELQGLLSRNPPPNFPEAIVIQNGETASGLIYGTTAANMYDLFVLDNDGVPVFKRNVDLVTAQNFHAVNDTLCVYASITDQFYIGLDDEFEITDTFQCVDGYSTDFHEFVMTEQGNVILGSFDQQFVDMSAVVEGGDPNAIVTGLVLQEIDPDDNLVFQWRSWDHFAITDALFNGGDTIDFTDDNISYVHFNSLEVAPDGNWIISSRHLSEVTKISRATGDILWRLGGKNNQFTFIGDSLNGFNLQHDARVTPEGSLMLFDNGVFHDPPQTRVVEYDIDDMAMTATLVWQFPNPYGDVTLVAGNAQRLGNGHTFISWGRRTTMPPPQDFFLEVDSAGNHVWEMGFVVPGQMGWIYRGYRLPFKGDSTVSFTAPEDHWQPRLEIYPNPARSVIQIDFGPEKEGQYRWAIYTDTGVKITAEDYYIEQGSHFSRQVNLGHLPSGKYRIQFMNSTGATIARPFLKLNSN